MKRWSFLLALFFTFIGCTQSVHQYPEDNPITDKTVIMYFPWTGNLTPHLYINFEDVESVLSKSGLQDDRLFVFFATSPLRASLLEITVNDGKTERVEHNIYSSLDYTSAQTITRVLSDVKSLAPSRRFAMTMGAHGTGWLPVSPAASRPSVEPIHHFEFAGSPLTRYFGGTTSSFQTEVSALADGIRGAGLRMEYILLDNCYMSNIEVAYELKDVADYLIASTSEIMAKGMPFSLITPALFGDTNYKSICKGFYDYYSTNTKMPYGTLAVIKTSEILSMASIMKEIYASFTFNEALRSGIQVLDGYNPAVFFDLGDYVEALCDNQELKQQFNDQLQRLIVDKVHTKCFYSMSRGAMTINHFSGITISDPSINPIAATKTSTSWYKATH